ncbi:MAG TPA: cytochrome c3 family protein [Ignavibacteriaceae bacterium]|nr:cytochrome c3 family protein [Ignavibacteriaceae bacterium]
MMKIKMKYFFSILLFSLIFTIIYSGCSDLQTDIPHPEKVSIHGEGVLTPGDPNFHGNYLKNSDFSKCQQCHAADLNGGITGVSCINCHSSITVHKAGIADENSSDFHGKFIRHNQWNLTDCMSCHGNSFSGGLSSPSCLPCHTAPGGPAACNTCHGSPDDPSRIAPPLDVNNNSSTDLKSVGAHWKHLYDNSLGNNVPCASCHKVPQTVNEPGHVDSDLPAEVIFKGLAVAFGAVNAVYDSSTATCANTYCHGNFEFFRDSAVATNQFAYTADKMTGNNQTLLWTKIDGTQIQCGSCHGLPPQGHIDVPPNSCYTCHPGVVDQDGNIIDKTKHINGVKNARGL